MKTLIIDLPWFGLEFSTETGIVILAMHIVALASLEGYSPEVESPSLSLPAGSPLRQLQGFIHTSVLRPADLAAFKFRIVSGVLERVKGLETRHGFVWR